MEPIATQATVARMKDILVGIDLQCGLRPLFPLNLHKDRYYYAVCTSRFPLEQVDNKNQKIAGSCVQYMPYCNLVFSSTNSEIQEIQRLRRQDTLWNALQRYIYNLYDHRLFPRNWSLHIDECQHLISSLHHSHVVSTEVVERLEYEWNRICTECSL